MSKYLLKQIIIIGVFALIFLTLLGLVYFLVRATPSCRDGIKNQGEENIDCGGPCPACRVSTLLSPEIIFIKAIKTEPGFYDIIAQIINPNLEYSTRQVNYQFVIFDKADKELKRISGNTFLNKGQKQYLVRPEVGLEREPERIALEFQVGFWQEQQESPLLELYNKQFKKTAQAGKYGELSALLVNRSAKKIARVFVCGLLYNANKEIVGARSYYLEDLRPQEEREILFVWFSPLAEPIYSLAVEAQPMP